MVYLFLAEGFEEAEALVTLDLLRRAGIKVFSVGVSGLCVTGGHGIRVEADVEIKDLAAEAVSAVVLPGGMPGAKNLQASPEVRALVTSCAKGGGLLCAICAAPAVLGAWGLLQGADAVCYPGYEGALLGARVGESPVCECGRIITSRGAGTVFQFALAIVEALLGRGAADKIGESIVLIK